MHITVQARWCFNSVVYEQFGGAEKLKVFSLSFPWQIFPQVDLSFLLAVMRTKGGTEIEILLFHKLFQIFTI